MQTYAYHKIDIHTYTHTCLFTYFMLYINTRVCTYVFWALSCVPDVFFPFEQFESFWMFFLILSFSDHLYLLDFKAVLNYLGCYSFYDRPCQLECYSEQIWSSVEHWVSPPRWGMLKLICLFDSAVVLNFCGNIWDRETRVLKCVLWFL